MEQKVHIPVDGAILEGALVVPKGVSGIVVFVHGSGSSRFSPRNMFVAKELQRTGIATLLIDLLTEEEDVVYETRFDIGLLTERLGGVLRWLSGESEAKDLAVGLFGASTGAAAAFNVATESGTRVAAVVSRGGRPDLAMEALHHVLSPTLFIVGGDDVGVIELNKRALAALSCEKKMEIVPGATHLFEEPGALEEVAHLATGWFARFLTLPAVPVAEEQELAPKFGNSAEKPTQPPGKTRGRQREDYRHLHRKREL